MEGCIWSQVAWAQLQILMFEADPDRPLLVDLHAPFTGETYKRRKAASEDQTGEETTNHGSHPPWPLWQKAPGLAFPALPLLGAASL